MCRQCRAEEGGGKLPPFRPFPFVRPSASLPFSFFLFPPPFGHFPYGSDVPRLGNEEEEEEEARPTFTFPPLTPPTFLATFVPRLLTRSRPQPPPTHPLPSQPLIARSQSVWESEEGASSSYTSPSIPPSPFPTF